MLPKANAIPLLSHALIMEEKSSRFSPAHRVGRGSPADLHQAIRLKDSSAIQRLILECKVSVNEAVRGTTPLSLAVYLGYPETVQQLIELGANVNKVSRDHNDRLEPPLFTACRLGMANIVKSLLLACADVNKTDFYNQSSLWIATRERRLDLVQTLIDHGARVNIAQKGSECPLYLSTKYLGYTGRREIALLLIFSGINVNMKDDAGRTPLYWAFKNLDKDMSKTLILCGGGIQPLTWQTVDKELGRDLKEDVKYYEWLQVELNSPYPLQRQCLHFLRDHLSSVSASAKCMADKIQLLPLPKTIIKYVSLDFLLQNDLCK